LGVNGETARLRPPRVETPVPSVPGMEVMPNLPATLLEPSVALSEE
jgi:hypothetical protein